MIPVLFCSVSVLALSGLLLRAASGPAPSATLVGQVRNLTPKALVAHDADSLRIAPLGYVLLRAVSTTLAPQIVESPGPDELLLRLSLPNGPIYFSKQTTNGWEKVKGFGAGIDATVAEYRSK